MCSPKEATQGKTDQVWWVTLWWHDKAPMAHQVREQPRLYPGGFCPWKMHLSWPNGVQHSRIHSLTQGQSHQAALPRGKIFLDHHSDLTYLHLQQGLSSKETVEAKKVFEAYTRTYRASIKHYHAENGRFAYNTFQQAVTQEIQTISYCVVNAHFQNGKVEKQIRYLQEQKRK